MCDVERMAWLSQSPAICALPPYRSLEKASAWRSRSRGLLIFDAWETALKGPAMGTTERQRLNGLMWTRLSCRPFAANLSGARNGRRLSLSRRQLAKCYATETAGTFQGEGHAKRILTCCDRIGLTACFAILSHSESCYCQGPDRQENLLGLWKYKYFRCRR